MARLAQSSEFTIMRTSGMGPWLALRTLLTLGGFFVLLTFAVGDYLAPLERQGSAADQGPRTRAASVPVPPARGSRSARVTAPIAVNVRAIIADGSMHRRAHLFEFDDQGKHRLANPRSNRQVQLCG
jgi:lipopolysaccharide export system permease protein